MFGIQRAHRNARCRRNFRPTIIDTPYLKVWDPDARYMLAMKCLSARWDTQDRNDVLAYTSADQVFTLITQYFPHQIIPPKTQFFVEEQFAKDAKED